MAKTVATNNNIVAIIPDEFLKYFLPNNPKIKKLNKGSKTISDMNFPSSILIFHFIGFIHINGVVAAIKIYDNCYSHRGFGSSNNNDKYCKEYTI